MMTKEEMINRLAIAINTLDAVSVSGKQNRNYLSGGLNLLEEIASALSQVEFAVIPGEQDHTEDRTGR